MTSLLPTPDKEVNHYSSVFYEDVASALSLVRESTASLTARLAFEFMVLTVAWPREVLLETRTETPCREEECGQ